MDTEINKHSNPWAARKEMGFFKALYGTIKQVLLKPVQFFDNLEVKDSYAEPYYFYLIMAAVSNIIYLVIEILFKKGLSKPINTLLLQISLTIVMLLIGIFIGTTILHLFVLLFKGKGGFKGTFNVLAYSSPIIIFYVILYVLPIVGRFIGIWSIIVVVIGLKRVHKFNTTRAVLACLLFPIVVVVFVFLLATVFVGPKSFKAGKLQASESSAEYTIRSISKDMETYAAANNGRYPLEEEIRASTKLYYSYLVMRYNNATINGYKYSMSFSPTGYELLATPEKCGVTGNKIFKIKTEGIKSQEECKMATSE